MLNKASIKYMFPLFSISYTETTHIPSPFLKSECLMSDTETPKYCHVGQKPKQIQQN